ncbi:hypothetical protein [Lichenicoccus roseus]|uniref:Lipoprotein n=1 Tax=Lichenicoccus roseus TaxID=2683649 RepID=A0A5R9J6J8_9PROT|nr:hypothetical protein [Lichenicoccus roseus]TLU73244.1 hypothetical protein FE263_07460 [Lichenicoccus roseus]
MKSKFLRTCSILALVGAVAGCEPTGPVFGSWQGRQPTGFGISPSFVDLVLHGNPGDTQGEYDIQAIQAQTTFDNLGDRNLIWGDRWTITRDQGPAGPAILHLHNLPNSQISTYAMLPNRVLVPLGPNGRVDLSQDNLRYSLVPLSPSSRAYGRL